MLPIWNSLDGKEKDVDEYSWVYFKMEDSGCCLLKLFTSYCAWWVRVQTAFNAFIVRSTCMSTPCLCISPSFICSMDSYFEIHMLKVAALLIHLISHFDAFTMPHKHKLWSICYQFLWQMLLSLHLLAILFFPFSPCNEAPLPHL